MKLIEDPDGYGRGVCGQKFNLPILLQMRRQKTDELRQLRVYPRRAQAVPAESRVAGNCRFARVTTPTSFFRLTALLAG